MRTHAAHPIPPCASPLASARPDSPRKIHCHHLRARCPAAARLLSAGDVLTIRCPHVRYPPPTSSLPASPLIPTIPAPYALNGRRPCACYPAAHTLDPRPMCARCRLSCPQSPLPLPCLGPQYPPHAPPMATTRALVARRSHAQSLPRARSLPAVPCLTPTLCTLDRLCLHTRCLPSTRSPFLSRVRAV
ncbi:hypothetical protein B0H14DRAFT_3470925 [Mycena olivaceomarginata]|nr:hypothetical protein B0H14DRAFT_3470925 [Mycena olivaceomarginata]